MSNMIIKRDGRKVEFNKQKIINAIYGAYLDVTDDDNIPFYAYEIANKIEQEVSIKADFSVEEIQDIVEKELTKYDFIIAKSYIRYRYKHEVARMCSSEFIDTIKSKLMATNVQNQNANVDEHSFGGRIGEAASAMMKTYALDYLLSPIAKKNHEENMIYIHDLDHYAVGDHNCLSIPFDDLLANGFKTRQTDVRPANSINTAFQLVAVIFQLQSLMQFGGVAATHLDWTMVPYVRKSFWKHFKDGLKYFEEGNEDHYFVGTDITKFPIEPYNHPSVDELLIGLVHTAKCCKSYKYAMDMTERELKQAVEGLYHNLNTLQSRSGNQLPFTSINYGTCTLPEGRMVIKALLEGSIKGVGKFHKTPIFPCGIFQCMKGVNRAPGDPNYDIFRLALESTARRIYPNYANVDWTNAAGYDINDPRTYFSTMGKRKLQPM